MEYLSVLIKFIKFWEWGKLGDVWCCFSPCSLKKDTHTQCAVYEIQSSSQGCFRWCSTELCVKSLYKKVQKCIQMQAVQLDMCMYVCYQCKRLHVFVCVLGPKKVVAARLQAGSRLIHIEPECCPTALGIEAWECVCARMCRICVVMYFRRQDK